MNISHIKLPRDIARKMGPTRRVEKKTKLAMCAILKAEQALKAAHGG